MQRNNQDAAIGNHEHQRHMAEALIAELGRDEAVTFCYEQGWQETLTIVLEETRN